MTNTKACLRTLVLCLMMGVFSSGLLQAQVILDPAWRVTPDTTKPGFQWRYFQNNVNRPNTDSRTETALAGQLTDSTGALLPNLGDPTAVGAATGEAAPADPANGSLYFEITNVINLDKTGAASNGYFPDDQLEPGTSTIPSTDGQNAEILTYLTLPAGTNYMILPSDDSTKVQSGPNPQDVFGRVTLGVRDGGAGEQHVSFVVPAGGAGTYPFRVLWANGGGGSHIEWISTDPDFSSNKKLINDIANGGIPAYRAAVGAVMPYVQATSPFGVPRQTELTSSRVTVVLADGTTQVNTNNITLSIDGTPATLTMSRIGTLLTVASGVIPGMHVSAEAHTAVLTFKDTGTYSRTQQWTFYNLENLILPASPVTGENFDSYPEATSPATTVPPGWTVTNYTWLEVGAIGLGWDLTSQANDPFVDWVMINTNTVAPLEMEVLDNYQAQTINGQPVTNWMSGNLIFAASDGRARRVSIGGVNQPNDYAPQIQITVTAPFNLSSVTNPVLTFSSGSRISGNHEQNSLEYSVDNGTNWLPALIMQNSATHFLNADGTYDAVKMLTNVWADVARFPVVQDPSTRDFISAGPLGQKFGDVLKTPISPALSAYVVERNDGAQSRKVEAIRLPAASKKSNVRLRFVHYGSCGWEWGVDNIAFYDIASTVSTPVVGANIGLNFGADEPSGSGGGSLAATNVAGVVPQANWNNLRGNSGTNTAILGDSGGPSGLSVTWTCPNTWSSTGRGEENNKFPTNSPDRKLMTGYLDTDNAAGVARVTVTGLDAAFGGGAYDVIVYALGGTSANRYGAYSIGTVTNIINTTANPTNFVLDAGVNITDTGDYGVFSGVTGNSFTLISSAVTPFGNGVRAPINAVQIIKARPRVSIARGTGSTLTVTYTGTVLQSATSLTGPWNDVSGATNPYTVTPPATEGAVFYRSKQ